MTFPFRLRSISMNGQINWEYKESDKDWTTLTDMSLARICRALIEAKTGLSVLMGVGKLTRLETVLYGIRVIVECPALSVSNLSEVTLDAWLAGAIESLYAGIGAIRIEEIDLTAKADEVEF